MRTPRQNQSLLRSALQNYHLQQGQTPLIGGSTVEVEGQEAPKSLQTPNMFKNLLS